MLWPLLIPSLMPILLDALKTGFGIMNKAYSYKGDPFVQFKQGERMKDSDVALFSVYRAANGFYATTESGKTVVGSSLSDVCRDVQAVLADEKVRETSDTMSVAGAWQKV